MYLWIFIIHPCRHNRVRLHNEKIYVYIYIYIDMIHIYIYIYIHMFELMYPPSMQNIFILTSNESTNQSADQ